MSGADAPQLAKAASARTIQSLFNEVDARVVNLTNIIAGDNFDTSVDLGQQASRLYELAREATALAEDFECIHKNLNDEQY